MKPLSPDILNLPNYECNFCWQATDSLGIERGCNLLKRIIGTRICVKATTRQFCNDLTRRIFHEWREE